MAVKICKMCERPIRKDVGRSAFHPACYKRHQRKLAHERRVVAVYGLAPGQYEQLLKQQGGKCAICKGGSTRSLAVDHDHKYPLREDGSIDPRSCRGLLCATCNNQLLARGARDRLDILVAAVKYLESYQARIADD